MKSGRIALLALPLAVLVLAIWSLMGEDGEWAESEDGPASHAAPDELGLPDAFLPPSAAPEHTVESVLFTDPDLPLLVGDLGPPDLAGTVVRRADGTPLENVIVSALFDDQDHVPWDDFTDRGGRFELRSQGRTPIGVEASWHLGLEVSEKTSVSYDSAGKRTGPPKFERTVTFDGESRSETVRLVLRSGDLGRDNLLIEIDTGWNLTGYVGDAAANPLQDALVVIGASDGPAATTGTDGRFVIRDLPRDTGNLRVTASKDGHVAHEQTIETLSAPAWVQEVSFTVVEGGALQGLVRASTGQPLPRALVTVIVPGEAFRPPREFRGVSDHDGRYLVDGIPAGVWNVHVSWDVSRLSLEVPGIPDHLASVPRSLYARGIEIQRGVETERNFELAEGATLAGLVVEFGGNPLARHRVSVWHELPVGSGGPLLNLEAHASTDGEGRFELGGLYPGSKQVRVYGPENDDVHQESVASTAKLELYENLELSPAGLVDLVLVVGGAGSGWIRGRVVDATGAPLSATLIHDLAERPEGYAIRGLSEASGRFEFRVPGQGEAGVVFAHSGYLPKTVILQPSPVAVDLGDVVMDLAPGVIGLVVDAATGDSLSDFQALFSFRSAGHRVPLIAVGTQFGDTFTLRRTGTGGEGETIEMEAQPGTFQFWGDQPSGDFTLSIEAPGYAQWTHTGELLANSAPVQFLVELQR
jgi:protocatechuate 3,4-dioxygenase beta subunit